MCITGIILKEHPEFELILANNRDEYVSRNCFVEIHSTKDGKFLCGIDPKAGGTWQGFNISNGNFCSLTNVSDQKGRGSRGLLVKDLMISQTKEQIRLLFEKIKIHKGYNIVWTNLNEKKLIFNMIGSRDQNQIVRKSNGAYSVNIRRMEGPGISIIGNDCVGDEFVKSPYLKNELQKVVESNINEKNDIKMRDSIASVMSTQTSQLYTWNFWKKYFFFNNFYPFNGIRRMQPGFWSYVMAHILLFINCLIIFRSFSISMIISFTIAMIIGLKHHWHLQHMFVTMTPLWIKKYNWGTITQTILMVSKKKIIFHVRDTSNWKKKSEWKRYEFPRIIKE